MIGEGAGKLNANGLLHQLYTKLPGTWKPATYTEHQGPQKNYTA